VGLKLLSERGFGSIMDSKNIYISSQVFSRKTLWLRNHSADSEWFFIGSDTLKLNVLIDSFFAEEQTLYLATDRNNSMQLPKFELLEKAYSFIEKLDFSIWDLGFKKVIEFDKIGVYRIGEQKR
jgi:hypothetical protein